MMKRTRKFRFVFFMLCLLLIASMLCTPALALSPASKDLNPDYEDYEDTDDEPQFVDWSLSKSGDSLTDGTRTLFPLGVLPLSVYHDPDTVYCSADTVSIPIGFIMDIRGTTEVDEDEEYESCVYAHSEKSDLVWIEVDNTVIYYATKDKADNIKKYLKAEGADFRLQKGNQIAPVDQNTFYSLLQSTYASTADRRTVNVTALASVPRIELLMRDKTGTLSCVYATIYDVDGTYYFVNHILLDNSYFDADGNFSYRQGTVTAVALDRTTQVLVTDVEATMTTRTYDYRFEDESLAPLGYEPVMFWVLLVLLGFLAPLVLLIIGLALPHSSKRGYPTYWYKLAIGSGVWIALSIAITVIILAVQ